MSKLGQSSRVGHSGMSTMASDELVAHRKGPSRNENESRQKLCDPDCGAIPDSADCPRRRWAVHEKTPRESVGVQCFFRFLMAARKLPLTAGVVACISPQFSAT